MGSIEIVPFKAEHAEFFHQVYRNDAPMASCIDNANYWRALEATEAAFSGFHGAVFLGCAGVAPMWAGVAEAWMLLTPKIEPFKLSMHRVCKRGLERAIEAYRLHRVQATVAERDVRARRWIEVLGFQNEAILRSYGPRGEDYILYGRIS